MGITSFGHPSLAPAAPTQIFTQRDSWRVHQLAVWTVIAWEYPQDPYLQRPSWGRIGLDDRNGHWHSVARQALITIRRGLKWRVKKTDSVLTDGPGRRSLAACYNATVD